MKDGPDWNDILYRAHVLCDPDACKVEDSAFGGDDFYDGDMNESTGERRKP